MRIGILSDTHNKLPNIVVEKLRDVDEIWHLGDVCEPGTIDALYALDKPMSVVRGNGDGEDWPLILKLEREGIRFHLVHIPPEFKEVGEAVDVVLHGHTHIPRDEVIGGIRFMNPGAVSGLYRGEAYGFAFMEVEGGEVLKWERVLL